MNLHKTPITVLLALSLLLVSLAKSQSVMDRPEPLGAVVKNCPNIVLSRVVDVGFVDLTNSGVSVFDKVSFERIRDMKGSSPSKFDAKIVVRAYLSGQVDDEPKVGKDYLLLGAFDGANSSIRSLIESTPENISEVKRLLIDAAPPTSPVPSTPKAITTPTPESVEPRALVPPAPATQVPVTPAATPRGVSPRKNNLAWPIAVFIGLGLLVAFYFRRRRTS